MGWLMKWIQQYWLEFMTKHKDFLFFISLIVTMIIVYNFDLYNCPDTLFYIALRLLAGVTGNVVLFGTVLRIQSVLLKFKVNRIGQYTLEIYATHMYVNHMFFRDKVAPFGSVEGFSTFAVSLLVKVVLTSLIIAILKSNRISDRLFYGNVSSIKKS